MMRKLLFIIVCLFISTMAMSQRGLQPQRPLQPSPQPELRQWSQRWKELNLSAEQKRRIIVLIQEQRRRQLLSQKALDQILSDEQKKKLRQWNEAKVKDSVKN